jgi:hypothetical protein
MFMASEKQRTAQALAWQKIESDRDGHRAHSNCGGPGCGWIYLSQTPERWFIALTAD